MNITHPIIVIVKGANWVGVKLTELMLEQKAHVVIVDDFTEKTVPFIRRFSDNKNFVFIEKDKLDTLRTSFTKIKYFIHLKHDLDTSDDKVSSKQFLSETKFIDEILSIAIEKNSTYLLTSSIHLHKDFLLKKGFIRHNTKDAYNESDLQDFIEKTVQEYVTKAGLDGRIVRLGNVYGPEMDLNTDPLLKQILTDAIYEDQVRVYGDGLEYMYYVYITDAIQGIIKSLFKHETKGKIYSITNPDEISVLTIVNKILALRPTAKSIKFVKRKTAIDPLYQKAYIPDENLSEIGWKPNVSFDRGIAVVYEYFKSDVSLRNYAEQVERHVVLDKATPTSVTRPDSKEVEIDFDQTVNLSDTFYGPEVNEETSQFRSFYNKLHSDNSPIYNTKKPAKGNKVRVGDVSEKQKEKTKYAKYAVYAVSFALVYILLVAPILQLVGLYIDIKNSSAKLNNFVESGYIGSYDGSSLSDKAKNTLAASHWMVVLLNKGDFESNINSIAKGLDDASLASQSMNKGNLNQYLLLNSKVPESSVTQAQETLLLINSAKSHLQAADKVNLYFGSKEEVEKVESWAHEMEGKLSTALNYSENTSGNKSNVLGVQERR